MIYTRDTVVFARMSSYMQGGNDLKMWIYLRALKRWTVSVVIHPIYIVQDPGLSILRFRLLKDIPKSWRTPRSQKIMYKTLQ